MDKTTELFLLIHQGDTLQHQGYIYILVYISRKSIAFLYKNGKEAEKEITEKTLLETHTKIHKLNRNKK